MVNIFRHYVPLATVLQLALEAGLFFLALLAGAALETYAFGSGRVASKLLPALVFAVIMVGAIGAFGLYRRDQAAGFPRCAIRFMFALSIGLLLASLVFPLWASGTGHREALEFAIPVAIAGVLAVRMAFAKRAGDEFFTHKILVLGTGVDALAIERALANPTRSAQQVVAFFPVNSGERAAVPRHRILPADQSLDEVVTAYGVRELIVAVREQRGGVLPLQDLLSCRLKGVRVTDLFSFYERTRGEVPVESLKASWLIYGDGFRQDRLRCCIKRTFDLAAALGLLAIMAPVMLVTAFVIYREGGGPIIFRQQRVGLGGRSFTLLKFRSMRSDAEPDGRARWAEAGDPRVTRFGRIMRLTRIDELPQLWNVLRGEMSFVGPRPERPCFVSELNKSIPFYPARHTVKPGITGWAQVRYKYGASVEDATRKLQFDLYYVKNHSLFLDLLILMKTVRVVLSGHGAR